jgi:poly-gamma-glutamate synthesis protein (capsule biosynthesis protein)
VLYGCGNFIDDYEGIRGYEEFRAELVLVYFPALAVDTGHLAALRMSPLRIRKIAYTALSRRRRSGWGRR